MDATATDSRRQRGLALATSKGKRFRHIVGGKYLVPSATSEGASGYVVDVEAGACTCADHETRAVRCKHLWAVEFFRSEVTAPDGTVVVTQAVRVTYSQEWATYTAAQVGEKDEVQVLLRSLCDGVREPEQKMGRPRQPLGDAIFSAAMKVYTGMSSRRASSDLRACERAGYVSTAPNFSTVCRTIERADLTPILRGLVEQSAKPLRAVERDFAIDSTGFSTNTYSRWFDKKYGEEKRCQRWVKLHALIGVETNAYIAINVTESNEADCPELPPLVRRAAANGFNLREVSADKAYLSHANLAEVEATGALPFIPFKVDSRPTGSPAWERMWHLYSANSHDFLARYHKRSNVEASFSAVKRVFGASLRSKTLAAQFNEACLKVLCYNLTRVVHSIHKLGIEPRFWQPQLPAVSA